MCKDMCNYVCIKLLWLSSFLSVAVMKQSDQSSKRKLKGMVHFIFRFQVAVPPRVTAELKQESKGRAAIVPCSVTSDKGTH